MADLLGTDTGTLKSQLKSGKTMSDLASPAGVSSDDLLSTIEGTRPERPQKPQNLASSLDTLSSALGATSEDLLERLTDGTGIADLLQANPEVSAQPAADQTRGGLVDGYA